MAIDEKKIVEAVVAMNPHGDKSGIIDAFGVLLTNHYADYYNRISYRFEGAVEKYDPSYLEFVTPLLTMSGHVCGFNTFGGIRRSNEWKALIATMCATKEEEVRALVAVLNALGWGTWSAVEVSPKRFVARSPNTYESEGHLREFGTSKRPGCFLGLGVAISFMNIVYSRGKMSENLNENEFAGEETKCRRKGDPYCEFVVTKR